MNIGPSATRYAHDRNQHGNDKKMRFSSTLVIMVMQQDEQKMRGLMR